MIRKSPEGRCTKIWALRLIRKKVATGGGTIGRGKADYRGCSAGKLESCNF